MSPTEPRNSVNVELTVLGSLAQIVLVVSVDAKQRLTNVWKISEIRNCESRGRRPGLPVPNNPYGLCEVKATLIERVEDFRAQEPCESGGGRPGLSVPHSPYGLCGRKATLEEEEEH